MSNWLFFIIFSIIIITFIYLALDIEFKKAFFLANFYEGIEKAELIDVLKRNGFYDDHPENEDLLNDYLEMRRESWVLLVASKHGFYQINTVDNEYFTIVVFVKLIYLPQYIYNYFKRYIRIKLL